MDEVFAGGIGCARLEAVAAGDDWARTEGSRCGPGGLSVQCLCSRGVCAARGRVVGAERGSGFGLVYSEKPESAGGELQLTERCLVRLDHGLRSGRLFPELDGDAGDAG